MIIGNRKVILNEILLIPIGETAKLHVKVDNNDDMHMALSFAEEAERPEKHIDYKYEDQVFKFSFVNFSDPFGYATHSPMHFADSDKGEKITLLATIQKQSGIVKVALQVMLEVENG